MNENPPAAPQILFPCDDYPMKVIGEAHPEFQVRVVTILKRHLREVDEEGMELNPSRNGRFVSLRFQIRAESEDHIKRLFLDLKTLPGIQMVL